jgi:alpha-ketoglutarate-dependent taurine dioxygenase
VIATRKLSETVGATVLDVDRDRLLNDPAVVVGVLEALEDNGVLVFPQIGVTDEEQVTFSRRLGTLALRPERPIPELTQITQDPGSINADYFRGNLYWHADGMLDEKPSKAGILTAHVLAPGDGGTEFASTYAAFDDLPPASKERLDGLRVAHTLEATQRPFHPDPTPEQLDEWRSSRPAREHPLVWNHRSGRRSMVLGATADYIVGMDVDEGRALLAELLAEATRPSRVIRHDWSVGDLVIWDNTGVMHRVTDYDPTSPRELHRTTVVGDEHIQ